MNRVVGLDLGVDRIRAVVLGPWGGSPNSTLELPWDPARPEDAVAGLKARLGPTRRLSLCVALGFLHPKRVKLPPAPAAERRRMIALEPTRFFPVREGSLAVALPGGGDFAFAMDSDLLDRWTSAFQTWAPVDAIEAAPTSLERALQPTRANGIYAIPAGPGEEGLVELEGGSFRSARRAPAGTAGVAALALPSREGVPSDFLCAWGAALGVDGPLDGMLLTRRRAARIRSRRVSRAAVAGVSCALALAFALWAVDRSRERTLEALREQSAQLTAEASAAVDLQTALAAIDLEREALGKAGGALDPLPVLAALSERLPAGVTVLNLRGTGEDWQIEGTAPDAAAILPLLDADDRFHDVRFLSASSRYREGNRTYETFSIAFRARPTT